MTTNRMLTGAFVAAGVGLAALGVSMIATLAVAQDDDPFRFVPPADPPPELSVTATPSVAVPLSADACNVAFTPSAGWTVSLAEPFAGATCDVGADDPAGAVRWRLEHENDAGKTIVLIFEGRHTSGATARVAVSVVMQEGTAEISRSRVTGTHYHVFRSVGPAGPPHEHSYTFSPYARVD